LDKSKHPLFFKDAFGNSQTAQTPRGTDSVDSSASLMMYSKPEKNSPAHADAAHPREITTEVDPSSLLGDTSPIFNKASPTEKMHPLNPAWSPDMGPRDNGGSESVHWMTTKVKEKTGATDHMLHEILNNQRTLAFNQKHLLATSSRDAVPSRSDNEKMELSASVYKGLASGPQEFADSFAANFRKLPQPWEGQVHTAVESQSSVLKPQMLHGPREFSPHASDPPFSEMTPRLYGGPTDLQVDTDQLDSYRQTYSASLDSARSYHDPHAQARASLGRPPQAGYTPSMASQATGRSGWSVGSRASSKHDGGLDTWRVAAPLKLPSRSNIPHHQRLGAEDGASMPSWLTRSLGETEDVESSPALQAKVLPRGLTSRYTAVEGTVAGGRGPMWQYPAGRTAATFHNYMDTPNPPPGEAHV